MRHKLESKRQRRQTGPGGRWHWPTSPIPPVGPPPAADPESSLRGARGRGPDLCRADPGTAEPGIVATECAAFPVPLFSRGNLLALRRNVWGSPLCPSAAGSSLLRAVVALGIRALFVAPHSSRYWAGSRSVWAFAILWRVPAAARASHFFYSTLPARPAVGHGRRVGLALRGVGATAGPGGFERGSRAALCARCLALALVAGEEGFGGWSRAGSGNGCGSAAGFFVERLGGGNALPIFRTCGAKPLPFLARAGVFARPGSVLRTRVFGTAGRLDVERLDRVPLWPCGPPSSGGFGLSTQVAGTLSGGNLDSPLCRHLLCGNPVFRVYLRHQSGARAGVPSLCRCRCGRMEAGLLAAAGSGRSCSGTAGRRTKPGADGKDGAAAPAPLVGVRL